jgi:hypothetical protein
MVCWGQHSIQNGSSTNGTCIFVALLPVNLYNPEPLLHPTTRSARMKRTTASLLALVLFGSLAFAASPAAGTASAAAFAAKDKDKDKDKDNGKDKDKGKHKGEKKHKDTDKDKDKDKDHK